MSYIADTLGWSDLLSKRSLKPWWETVRSTTLVVMTIISTFLFVTKSGVAVSCIPASANVSYSAAEAKFVEKVCGSQQLFLPHNMFWMSALATGVTFVFNNFWFYSPAVGDAIRRFSAAYELHDELQAVLPSLVGIIATPNSGGLSNEKMEQRHKLRELFTLLGKFMKKKNDESNPKKAESVKKKKRPTADPTTVKLVELSRSESSGTRGQATAADDQTNDNATDKRYVVKVLAKFYMCRNVFSLVLALFLCGGNGRVIYVLDSEFSFMRQWNFTCTRPIQLESNYSCIYSGLATLYGSSILLMVCYTIQVITFIVLLIKYCNVDDLELLNIFAKKSDTDTSRMFSVCIAYLKKEPHVLAKEANQNFGHAIDQLDIDFFFFVMNTLGVDLKSTFTDTHRAMSNYKYIHSDFKCFGEILLPPIVENLSRPKSSPL